MQAEVSKPVSPPVFIGLLPGSTMVSASFSILSVDAQNKTIMLPNPTTAGVTLSVDPETGANTITVQFSEPVTLPTAGFSLTLNIEDVDDLEWSFDDRSAVFHDVTHSAIPAGIVIRPEHGSKLMVVFWCATSPSDPDRFPTFRFSLGLKSVLDGSIINIDDPTVILKPPPIE